MKIRRCCVYRPFTSQWNCLFTNVFH